MFTFVRGFHCVPRCSFSTSTNYLNRHLNSFLSSKTPTFQSLLQSHSLIITSNNAQNPFIASKLISLYTIFNKPHSATIVFDSITLINKDTFLWNSIIKSHFSNGNYQQTLQFYVEMRLSNTLFDHFTIPMVVSACAELGWVYYGKCVHGLVSKCGIFVGHSSVGSCLVYMYVKCGVLEDAHDMFDEMSVRDVVSWTALIIGFVQNGESEKGLDLVYEMHRIGGEFEKPNFRTIEGGLQACGNLGALVEGRGLHALVVKSEVIHSRMQSSLLSMYAKCGDPGEAYLSFCEVLDKDLFSWTSIIGMYARYGLMRDCLKMFWEMQVVGIYPDDVVVSCILLGFVNSVNVQEGKAFHGLITRRNYTFTNIVYDALLSMYCKFGLPILAEKVFNSVDQKDKEFWNTMVSGYYQMGLETKCIKLYREMQLLRIESDANSLVFVILSCSKLQETRLGRSLHCYTIKNGLVKNVTIVNSLIEMYGKSGNVTAASQIFCKAERDIVTTWNTLMSAYCHSGHFAEAIALFDKMISENLKPDLATLTTVISACSHLAYIAKGEMIYNYIKEEGFELTLSLTTALVDMYAKFGQLEKSRDLFNSTKDKDVVSWNVMISGYGMHGDAKLALQIFEEMENSNVKPNEVTFLALFSACAHAGLVREGKYLFDRMRHYSVIPNLKHYACMVDLLGRSGDLQEAEAMVLSMPIPPDGGVWGSLLSACKIHGDTEMGIRVAKHAIDSDPGNDGYYIMLSNLYSSAGSWEEAERARVMIKERRVQKIAGWSAV